MPPWLVILVAAPAAHKNCSSTIVKHWNINSSSKISYQKITQNTYQDTNGPVLQLIVEVSISYQEMTKNYQVANEPLIHTREVDRMSNHPPMFVINPTCIDRMLSHPRMFVVNHTCIMYSLSFKGVKVGANPSQFGQNSTHSYLALGRRKSSLCSSAPLEPWDDTCVTKSTGSRGWIRVSDPDPD